MSPWRTSFDGDDRAASMREPSSSDPSPIIKIGGDQFRLMMMGEAIGRRGERDAVPVERPTWGPPPGGPRCAATSWWVGSMLGATGIFFKKILRSAPGRAGPEGWPPGQGVHPLLLRPRGCPHGQSPFRGGATGFFLKKLFLKKRSGATADVRTFEKSPCHLPTLNGLE